MKPRLLVLGLVLTLAACGKAGSPVVPGSNFPRPYPNTGLKPTQFAAPTAPEDQAGMKSDGKAAQFTDKGTYIDPSVRDVELRRSSVAPGATLPYTQTNDPVNNTPFNQTLGRPSGTPLDPNVGTTPQDEEQNPQ
jgi:hypothetical protein